MNDSLPFTVPEDNLELNLVLVFLIINHLHKTTRGKLILNFERLTIYIYLTYNPHILHKVLTKLSKKSILLKSYESSSFKSENNSTEILYENKVIKFYIQILMSKKLIKSEYDEKIGFVFLPVESNENFINDIEDKYLTRTLNLITKIKQINSTSISEINTTIKNIIS